MSIFLSFSSQGISLLASNILFGNLAVVIPLSFRFIFFLPFKIGYDLGFAGFQDVTSIHVIVARLYVLGYYEGRFVFLHVFCSLLYSICEDLCLTLGEDPSQDLTAEH